MTERQIENRVKKLKAIEKQRKDLEAQEKALKEEIKRDMESKGLEELKTKNFIIRWKEIISNTLSEKRNLATATIHSVHIIVYGSLEDLVQDNMIQSNPAAKAFSKICLLYTSDAADE